MKNDSIQGGTPENIAEAKKTKERNVKSILWNKFLDILEDSTFRQIISVILLIKSSLILALVLTYPEKASELLLTAWKFENFLIPKIVWSFILIFNFKRIFEILKNLIPEFPEVKEEPKGDTIEWIPVVELLDHLFEFESFKRDDIEKKFGIPRNRFTDLAQKLEELCVLKRGENNSRILNKEFARSDIANILAWKSTAEDLRLVSRKIDDSSWTYEPAGKSMVDKVKDFLTPNPEEEIDESPSLSGFVTRKIGSFE